MPFGRVSFIVQAYGLVSGTVYGGRVLISRYVLIQESSEGVVGTVRGLLALPSFLIILREMDVLFPRGVNVTSIYQIKSMFFVGIV